MGKQSSLKRRNNKQKHGETKEKSNENDRNDKKDENSNSYQNRTDKEPAEESTWNVIRRHPTFLALVFLGIPFGLPILLGKFLTKAILQYPHHLNRALDVLDEMGYKFYEDSFRFRPAVSMGQPRQMLVIGSMSSGTSQVSYDLRESLGLEVGHEDTDTTQYFVRDGVVSWFHGVQYLDRSDPNERARTILEFCAVAWRIYNYDKIQWKHAWSNYGTQLILFGPTNFSLPHWHPNFRTDFLDTCRQTMNKEFGCGLANNCPTPFQRTMLQTRQPWRIVTSLVVKYCGTGSRASKRGISYRSAPISLMKLFQALYPDYSNTWFPAESGEENDGKAGKIDDNLKICTNQMATYVHLWYNELLDSFEWVSKQQGVPERPLNQNFMVYPIETTTICQLAEMAGFDLKHNHQYGRNDEDLVVYPPNAETVAQFCQEQPNALFGNSKNQFNSQNNEDDEPEPEKEMFEEEGRNKQVRLLNVTTVRGIVDDALGMTIDALHVRMGYDELDLLDG